MTPNQKRLTSHIIKFIKERNWSQYHTAKDIAMCLSVESNEVLEVFLWKEESEINTELLKQEIGDTYYALLLLCNKMNINLEEALLDKLEINQRKYPINKCYGKNMKYTEL